jgi:hypothetical protein
VEPWLVEWQGFTGPHSRRAVATPQEAVELFLRVDRSAEGPVLMDFYRESSQGGSLTVGAGRPSAVLSYQDSLDPPYFVSMGTEQPGQGTETWAYGGHESEFLERNLISKASALEALREYLTTGQRPSRIAWEEV